MYLRFLDDLETRYEITSEVSQLSTKKVCIYQGNIPENTNGFEIIEDDETVVSYHDYMVVYKKTDNCIVFTSDMSIHYVYYTYNEFGYVSGYMLSNKEVNKPNAVLVRSGRGRIYENVPDDEYLDENGIYRYKVVDDIVVKISEDERIALTEEKLQKVKAEKIAILSAVCREMIEKGIEYNGEWFSSKLEDRSNLKILYEYSKSTGMSMPYHANDNACKLYSKEDLLNILTLVHTNYLHTQTYFNQLKMYVKSLSSIEEIESIYYGQELTGEYMDNYNTLLKHSQQVVETHMSNLDG